MSNGSHSMNAQNPGLERPSPSSRGEGSRALRHSLRVTRAPQGPQRPEHCPWGAVGNDSESFDCRNALRENCRGRCLHIKHFNTLKGGKTGQFSSLWTVPPLLKFFIYFIPGRSWSFPGREAGSGQRGSGSAHQTPSGTSAMWKGPGRRSGW
jgi:hypothetical protein